VDLASLSALLLLGAAPPDVDPARVDRAIAKGVEYLRTAGFPVGRGGGPDQSSGPLILLTLVHAGVPEKDPLVQQLLKEVLELPLERTYQAALCAMALEELHRVKYQGRIWQCAQFLVDNQCRNGQWSYGEATPFVSDVPTGTAIRRADVASGAGARRKVVDFESPAVRQKPAVARAIPVSRRRDGPAAGDNSNTQYGALGLRACHDAGILIPKEVVDRARDWWISTQGTNLSAVPAKDAKGPVATAGGARAEGWCYGTKEYCAKGHHAYGSMTAGGLAAVSIYDFMLGLDWRKNPAALGAARWLGQNFSVTDHPGLPEFQPVPRVEYFYFLYALERAGMLFGTEQFGPHRWYEDGAQVLLETQIPTGAWDDGGAPRSTRVWDTCFAILFLRRATRPLVASEDPVNKPR
jgi:hypothetical protein